jgi:hypothetical protein
MQITAWLRSDGLSVNGASWRVQERRDLRQAFSRQNGCIANHVVVILDPALLQAKNRLEHSSALYSTEVADPF